MVIQSVQKFFELRPSLSRIECNDQFFDHNLTAYSAAKETITPAILSRALCTCLELNSWKSITIRSKDEDTTTLEILVTPVPLVSRVTVITTLPDKDRFRGAYPLPCGTPFDDARHHEGIERVRALLVDRGYRHAEVVDTITPEADERGVVITLTLDEGDRCVLADIACTVFVLDEDDPHLARSLQESLNNEFYGEPATKETMQAVADTVKQQLFRRGYADVSVEYHELVDHRDATCALTLAVRCGHRRKIDYVGNHALSRRELRELLERFGKTLPYIPAPLLCDEVAARYRSRGYCDVNISFEEAPGELHLIIAEGKQRCVVHNHFLGGDPTLSGECQKIYGKSPWAYTDTLRAEKRSALYALYYAAGYWDMRIADEYLSNDSDLLVTIDCGVKRTLHEVVYENVPEALRVHAPSVSMMPGEALAKNYPQSLTRQYLIALRHAGYLGAQPTYEIRDTEGKVTLACRIDGDVQGSIIDAVLIDGATVVPPQLLTKMSSGLIGSPCELKLMERTVERFRQLGVFSRVGLAPINPHTPDTAKTVVLTLVDDARHEIRARAGMQFVGQNFEFRRVVYKIGGSWLWRNPASRADTARIDVDYVRYRREAQLWYSWPWETVTPIKTDIKAYTIRYDQPFVIGSPHVLYTAFQNGILACVSGRTHSLWAGCTTGLEWVSIGCISIRRAREIEFDPGLVNRQIPYYFCEPSILWEQVDSKVDPTQGYRFLASFKGLVPLDLSRAVCGKIIMEAALFQPVRNCGIALRARMGHIFNEDFRRIMPIERFYLGGSYSLRGYEPDLAPPVNQIKCDGCVYNVPVGGRSVVLLNGEFRVPMSSLLNAVFFVDCGALEHDRCAAIMPRGLLGDTGFGLRVKTPVGPLRFDIGWKWHTARGECPYMWYLTLGNAF